MITKTIVSPTGGFGNHLRWLLLLDEQFTIEINDVSIEPSYNTLKGVDWPALNDIAHIEVPNAIKQEIESHFGDYANIQAYHNTYTKTNDKFEFINKYVYDTNRTWHNWLLYERTFGQQLTNCIEFDHENHKFSSNKLYIVTTIDPIIAYRSYLKFNSYLNNLSKQQFLEYVTNQNNMQLEIANNNKNVLHLNGDLLYNKTLSKELYDTATQWFGLDNNYKCANELHRVWFNLHRKAEQEIIQDLTALYNRDNNG